MAINNNYFLISATNKPDVASAFSPEGTRLAHELIADMEIIEEFPFEFLLVKLSAKKMDSLKVTTLLE